MNSMKEKLKSFRELGVICVLIALIILLTIARPVFISPTNFINVVRQTVQKPRRKMKNRSLRQICSTENRSGSGQQKRKPSRLRTSFSYRITGRSPQILRKAYRLKRPAAVSRTAALLQALLLFLPGAERLLPGPLGEICSPWCTETAVL